MRWFSVLLALGACDDATFQPDAMIDGAQQLDAASTMPATLAETGLCVDAACTQIAPGIYPYTPRFELWSDTATKRRWIYLPPGTQINTSNMDHWDFPVGTKLWKEFTRGSVRVETRIVMRIGPGTTQSDWFYGGYVWNATQDATTWAEFGQADANGTQHDVPSKTLCRLCHENNKPSRVLGFSAVQLAHEGAAGEIDLADAITNNWLSQPPAGSAPSYGMTLPGTSYEPPALGYLHVNCGHCHNPNSNVSSNTPLDLRLTVGTLGALATIPTYQTAVDVTTADVVNGHNTIVEPGQPDQSVLIDRFESSAANLKMPAAGSEMMDTAGLAILRAWIENIP